ncbi:ead/Ea22-like family protein [Enterobacter hormaechei]|uniref:ead/Ea22-like family protein n=1 Tax=Enterobacter hormaechei TaxID=158836 RepID=UPI003D701A83
MTPKNQALRERYTPKPVPKCHICGATMTIGAASASRIVYGCTGATHDEAGCHYAPGRSIADDHYAQSRVTVADVSDPDVIALLDELEAKDKSISFLKDQLAQLANFNPDWDKLEAATDSLREHMAELTAARARIAELEAREVREERNQFLVVRYPGKSPVIKHCTGDLEEFLRQLLTQDNLATIDIVTHRYYGVGGQWVQDADEYLHMMDSAGRINGEG